MVMNDPLMFFLLFIALLLSYTIPGPEENIPQGLGECVVEEECSLAGDTEELP